MWESSCVPTGTPPAPEILSVNPEIGSKPVFIVDNCPTYIDGLRIWLAGSDYELCRLANAVGEIDTYIRDYAGACLICIIGPHLHVRDAFDACRCIRALVPMGSIIFVTNHADNLKFREDVADAGALACLPVTMTKETLLSVLSLVLVGQSLIALDPDAARVQPLSKRELEVLRLIGADMTNT